MDRDSNFRLSVSHTTRPPRPGEQDGVHYHFVDQDTFRQLIQNNAFLEHAEVFGHFYGTGRQQVEELLAAGHDVLLDIDWQGAQQIRASFPRCCSIFILPPSLQELNRRLSHRGQDSPSVIEDRMNQARAEISHWEEFDFVVVNDDFDAALEDLMSIVHRRQPVRTEQSSKIASLLAELLEND